MKKILYNLLFLFIHGCALCQAQNNLSIFRNDRDFSQIKLTDETKLTHTIKGDSAFLNFTDWVKGKSSVNIASIDSCILRQSDIPVLRLTFQDYPEADCLWDKELFLHTLLDIEGNGYTDDMSGLSLQVKGRGNSTWGMPKKPMRLKFSKKTSICGFKKAKNFVLLNNYLDPTLMRNAIAMWLAKRLGVPYANTIVPCHVFINGHYAGAYTLTEKVGINSGSVDIDENEGILFELSLEFDEKYKFRSALGDEPVMVKDPDFDELYEDNPKGLSPEERLELWEKDFNNAEELTYSGKGAEAFDIESAVNYILLYQFVLNNEIGFPKSLYIHKKSLNEGEKYYLGPAWDFDVAYNFAVPTEEGFKKNSPEEGRWPWVTKLLSSLMETEEFKVLYEKRWEEFMNYILPELMEYFDYYAALIEPSAKLNGIRWSDQGPRGGWAYLQSSFDFKAHAQELREWLVSRINFLNKKPVF